MKLQASIWILISCNIDKYKTYIADKIQKILELDAIFFATIKCVYLIQR